MFDPEQAIAEWRRQLLAAGVKDGKVLDELESHLREELERQRQSSQSGEQAFALAVRCIGRPVALEREFAKAGVTRGSWRRWLREAFLRFAGNPLSSPAVFTIGARETLELGRKEALGFHHDFIGTEHVLLGLLESEKSVVRELLQRMSVDPRKVRSEIVKIVGRGPAPQSTVAPPYTPRVKKALAIAGSEARALNQPRIGVEHIFLGLLLEGGGVAARVLQTLGVDVQTARQEILTELGRTQHGA